METVMGETSGLNFGTVLNLIFGPGGVLLVGVYIFWLGMNGRWMFAAVHQKIVEQLEARLAEAARRADAAEARAEKYQQLYIDSRRVIDASTTVAAGVIEQITPSGAKP